MTFSIYRKKDYGSRLVERCGKCGQMTESWAPNDDPFMTYQKYQCDCENCAEIVTKRQAAYDYDTRTFGYGKAAETADNYDAEELALKVKALENDLEASHSTVEYLKRQKQDLSVQLNDTQEDLRKTRAHLLDANASILELKDHVAKLLRCRTAMHDLADAIEKPGFVVHKNLLQTARNALSASYSEKLNSLEPTVITLIRKSLQAIGTLQNLYNALMLGGAKPNAQAAAQLEAVAAVTVELKRHVENVNLFSTNQISGPQRTIEMDEDL